MEVWKAKSLDKVLRGAAAQAIPLCKVRSVTPYRVLFLSFSYDKRNDNRYVKGNRGLLLHKVYLYFRYRCKKKKKKIRPALT